ncbi:MAG: efflux RND transporter permease subunit [Candidatus Omnitrophota bacterium]|jgi:multidrug efflux pump subunit AcrB|nr:MAG: efflux RND transporter permease subunit [Candidatus Omnitrophota bacterium]
MSENVKLSPFSKIVAVFLDGNLSIVLILLSLLVGAAALLITPREEEPQIVVPFADIFVSVPGASSEEVERLVATRLEKLLWQIDGVEYVYSTSSPGQAVVTVRFYVGEDRENSLLKLYNKIESNIDQVPPVVAGWVVKPIEIDDVPILTLTLHSNEADGYTLRRVSEEVIDRLQGVKNTGRTCIVGGPPRQIRVELDSERLRAHSLTPLEIDQKIRATNVNILAGSFERNNTQFLVEASQVFSSIRELEDLVVGVFRSQPVHLKDVAVITDGPAERENYTRIGFGPAAHHKVSYSEEFKDQSYPSVTIALAKKKGTNAVWVVEEVLDKLDELKEHVIPDNIEVLVTRNYGESADEKVNELVEGLVVAIITVIALIAYLLGWREGLIVAFAVPITFALTLFFNMMLGYTINRVTLFALTLSLGLVVDDPIVDVENIYRHFTMKIRGPRESVLYAVDEVRPPIILATLAVIISFVPMFFITGMMGPYMAPMALNVPLAMLMSLLVAFTITPWMTYHVLKGEYGVAKKEKYVLQETLTYRIYSRIIGPFIDSKKLSYVLLTGVAVLLVISAVPALTGFVPLKMLPFDNKNEFQILIDMPEGTTLEETDAVVREYEDFLRRVPEITDFASYVGVASPIDFNGMVRHYYFRKGSHLADIRINLVEKDFRKQQSHTIALRLRNDITAIGNQYGANVKIVETPPGPPVISTVVAEIYGAPDKTYDEMAAAAKIVRRRMESVRAMVDVDDMVEAAQTKLVFEVDREKAALNGISSEQIAQTLALALGGQDAGVVHVPSERNPLTILLQLPRSERSGKEDLSHIAVRGETGALVQMAELGYFVETTQDISIYHKNLERVVYVFGEMAGRAPAEAILELQSYFKENPLPPGFTLVWSGEGEWKITLDVFRDLGLAFGAALVGIYVLLIIETGSFFMPIVIMIAIPLTMIGIMPGFYLLNVLTNVPAGGYEDPTFFTATAMIGMIALSGIVVRNSILLIDFIHHALRDGKSLRDALIESGAVRFRPILLTAGTALLGNVVITLDPIFSGLAWSIIFGIFASTAFTLLVIPVIYYLLFAHKHITTEVSS